MENSGLNAKKLKTINLHIGGKVIKEPKKVAKELSNYYLDSVEKIVKELPLTCSWQSSSSGGTLLTRTWNLDHFCSTRPSSVSSGSLSILESLIQKPGDKVLDWTGS